MELKKKIRRRRALRAAQAVTLGLAIAAGGCSNSHETGEDAGTDTGGTDTLVADAMEDTTLPECEEFPPTDEECCDIVGGFWSSGRCELAVPGPFVPPRMA